MIIIAGNGMSLINGILHQIFLRTEREVFLDFFLFLLGFIILLFTFLLLVFLPVFLTFIAHFITPYIQISVRLTYFFPYGIRYLSIIQLLRIQNYR